ncbi:MAG TPA: hypothetical protein VF875_16610 [Anaeromyxobacter sp.]
MPRADSSASIEAILRDVAERVASRVSGAISRHVGELVEARLQADLTRGAARRPSPAPRRRPRGTITRWTADVRARRVPKFVIEATGLETKKKIVAKYGANASFEKGKPLPRPK